MAVLMALAALGVQIAPLLAGAGVFGLAVGFGSQTVVRDIMATRRLAKNRCNPQRNPSPVVQGAPRLKARSPRCHRPVMPGAATRG
jgi:hypothetical protein